jgi:hypothetical protein
MHIGYAILMYVNLFPLIGMASLLLILPPRPSPQPRASAKAAPPGGKMVSSRGRTTLVKNIVIGLFSLWLVIESTRLTLFSAMPWENKLMVVPAWRMFADGGVFAGGKWRLILVTPHGKVDATDIALQALPHLWRDRFYIDTIFHDLLNKNTGPGSLVDRLIQSTEKMYRDRQLQSNESPVILNVGFDLYRWKPALRPH